MTHSIPPNSDAIVVYGGWEGHQPALVARLFADLLRQEGFTPHLADTLDAFLDAPQLGRLRLIVPVWTMGTITKEQLEPVCQAVRAGVGIAGCHGGMCDSFRNSTEWQFMTGGQWVAHPGNDGVRYPVHLLDRTHPVLEGLADFTVASEQYYMHVDPAARVLATTPFPTPGADGPHTPNGPVQMPVLWTKHYGAGRVFYCSLGHQANILEAEPVRTIMRRGFVWAARQPNPS